MFFRKSSELTVDNSRTYQKIHSFGVSAAWWAQEVGNWDNSKIDAICDLLFSRERGIGLNIVRYNLGGGVEHSDITSPLRKANCIETTPGKFDHTRDKGAINIINHAVDRGCEVIVFTNSPPERMTKTGKTSGAGKECNLREDSIHKFSTYLVDAVKYLREELRWPIHELSPINEPQWNWATKNNQEGCHYEPEDTLNILRALHHEIDSSNEVISISAIDSADSKLKSNKKYIDILMSCDVLSKVINHYAIHSYWSSNRDKRKLTRYIKNRYPHLELWMTEWTEMKSGQDHSMDSAMVLAETIHADFTISNVSSWQYWIALSNYDYRDGLIYFNEKTKESTPTKRLYVLGQWSRFISKSAYRVHVNRTFPSYLLISAYINPDGALITVIINKSSRRDYNLDLSKIGNNYAEIMSYVTSDKFNLEKVDLGGDKNITLKPNSVSTVIFNKKP